MSAAELANPDLHANGDAHAVWRQLRATAPVAWTDDPEGPGFWSVTSYEYGSHVLKDWRTFSSMPGTTLEGDRHEPDPAAGRMLPLLDPPQHGVLRRAVMPFFGPRRLAEVEAECRTWLPGLLDACAGGPLLEVNEAIGSRLPIHVSLRLLGIPLSDEQTLLPIIRGTLSCDETERFVADAELLMYLGDLVTQRRKNPDEDLLSIIAAVRIDGATLSEETVLLTFVNFLSAGLTTTRLAINGAIHALAEHPEQWRRLRADGSVQAPAIEEIIRWTSPSLAVLRTARKATVLAGQRILPQQRVAVWLPSLNRDESVFDRADEFRHDRQPNRHIGFGTGVHTCIGMSLARIELRLLLNELIGRWRHIDAAAAPTRLRSLVLQGIDRLPLRVEPD